jgi:protein-S-isoprenylcysteine O-methyltransferase Ste14
MMALNLSLSLYLVIGALFEERKLLQEFGEDYAAYQDRTPMLFPKLRKQPTPIKFP